MPSSDPHAWLRPIYRQLAATSAFEQVAPVVKFQRLMDAASEVLEAKVATLRQSSPAAQSALLAHLAMMEAQGPLDPSAELWRVRKGKRDLVCLAVHMPHGIDVRLLEEGDIRRTQLVRDAPSVELLSGEWRSKLLGAGWAGA